METTIKTSFNFAKEIQCNFITKNNLNTPILEFLPVSLPLPRSY